MLVLKLSKELYLKPKLGDVIKKLKSHISPLSNKEPGE